ncbi:hypothetical protein JYU34_012833 [Plutella xylostella]|uniref:Uncharacterized protein n=1 Tax=Plutella xylostella TaxID=51655 RepID=A0ABQ7QD87_PLUXY|nr:hypothetical protein JYU34_012833 [Plutella xylostella]
MSKLQDQGGAATTLATGQMVGRINGYDLDTDNFFHFYHLQAKSRMRALRRGYVFSAQD